MFIYLSVTWDNVLMHFLLCAGCILVLDTLYALMSNTKVVKEAMIKGNVSELAQGQCLDNHNSRKFVPAKYLLSINCKSLFSRKK